MLNAILSFTQKEHNRNYVNSEKQKGRILIDAIQAYHPIYFSLKILISLKIGVSQ